MSIQNAARRTAIEVFFSGTDITKSLMPYLLSLTYTDNEEGSTDDLQIKIEDKDGVWLTKWLNQAIQSSASADLRNEATGQLHEVTSQTGVKVRSRQGEDYYLYGTLMYGAIVAVKSIEHDWANIDFDGKNAYVNATYLAPCKEETEMPDDDVVKGLKIHSAIVCENWNSDGVDKVLDCGQFELDSVNCSGPPSTITIKATSLPYSNTMRQTKKSKSWEAYWLSGIVSEMAQKNKMGFLYLPAYDPYYKRAEQVATSDVAFLQILCQNAGLSLKISNNIIVVFDQAEYEAREEIRTIRRGKSGGYSSWKLSTGEADMHYASCHVSYTNPKGELIEATAYSDDYDENAEDNQCLEHYAKVESIAEAQELAAKQLRLRNKYEYSASFTFPGDPSLYAGGTVRLVDWGYWSGKYMIKSAKHSVSRSGYTTQITLRRVLEGY